MARRPAVRRSGCPISYALEIFGDRWTLLVLRDLILKGKRHYRELLAAEEGVASNILSDRLKRLEDRGLIARAPDARDRRRIVYRATPKGIALIPVLLEISAWGASQDELTAAPSQFLTAFRADRDGMIARIAQRLKTD